MTDLTYVPARAGDEIGARPSIGTDSFDDALAETTQRPTKPGALQQADPSGLETNSSRASIRPRAVHDLVMAPREAVTTLRVWR